MRISIVIANYNYERYVEAAIQSVLSQDYPHRELIIVDDGSTDGSRAILRQYESQAKIVRKDNGGQASAFNAGFRHCGGDLVYFLDADDMLAPGTLRKVVDCWQPEMAKLHFPLDIVDERGHLIGAVVPRARLSAGSLREEVLERGTYISPPSSGNVYSSWYLQAVMPVPEAEWIYADAYLICQAPLWGEIGCLSECAGYYRRHSLSATNVSTLGTGQILQKINAMYRIDLLTRQELSRAAAKLGLQLGSGAVTEHWLHLKTRLAKERLEGRKLSSVLACARQLVRAVWRAPEVSLVARIQFSIWSALVACLPPSGARMLIQTAFSPGVRNPWRWLRQLAS